MFKKYPFTKQTNLKDCGAASVQMIIKYYNGYMSMHKLSEMLKTNKNGTTAYHMVKVLEILGFEAYGLKSDKIENTKIPFIANVIIENSYKHYIVVYEVNSNYVLIADPTHNHIKKISHEEFYKIWTGISLIMHPIKPIIKQKNISCKKYILRLVAPYKAMFIKMFLLSIVITILSIVSSFFFQIVIDNVDKNLKYFYLTFTIIFILKILVDFFRNHLLIKFTNDLDKHLIKNTFQKILELPYNYYRNHTTGEVVSRISDLVTVRDIISKGALTLFADLPLTIFSGILLFYINKYLFLAVLIVLTLYIIILITFKNKINASIENTLQNKSKVNSYMVESISGFETVKGLNLENKINNIFNKQYTDYINSNQKLNNITNTQYFLKDFVNVIGQIIIMVIGIYLVKEDVISLGILITYTILISLFLDPVRNIIDLDFEIKEALNAMRRVLELVETKQEKTDQPVGHIEIKNLNFSFDDIHSTLKNINIEIKRGTKVLITGKSGSGKSTLLKIIKGYYSNYEGEIIIDNKPANKILNKIVYLSQKEILFTGTTEYNLTIKGSNNIDKIKDICHTDEIVMHDELKYNMLLEEDGFNISGGQRQRIALARSLHDFDVLIIDEGLNSVDTNLERKILKKLFNEYQDKTIIIISHRLDNLDLFNQFIEITSGEITLNERRC